MVPTHSLPRNASKVTLGIVLGVALALANPVRAEVNQVAPGDTVSLTCPTGWESVNVTPTEVTAVCIAAPTATPTASATATPTPLPTTSPSSTPTPTPSPSPSPTSTPSPTPAPSSPASSTSCAPAGFGAAATGGTTVVNVSTAAELKAAASQSGRIIRLASGVYDVGGALNLASNTTIERAPGSTAIIKGGLFLKSTTNVIIRDLAIRASDESGSPGELDAITMNGLTGPVSRVLVSNVTAIWGPDIGGIAVLGDVNDVTVQCSILGEGLRFSEHHEGAPPTGHSMGLSVFQLRTDVDPADRLTFRLNLLTTSDRRMPVIHGARQVDWVNNWTYNFGRNGPDGNPRGLNFVGNVVQSGPLTEADPSVWRSRPHSANPCCYPASVYLSDNLAVGFPYRVESNVTRTTPAHALSVTPIPASQVKAFVLANAGPLTRDATDTRILDNARNGTGVYMNGHNYPPPNPQWPE